MEVKLRILGESVIEIGENTLEPSSTHVFALMLYLAIERDKLVPRSVLATLLFPDAAPAAASHNLRQLVYRVRRKGAPLTCTAAAILLPGDSVAGAPESAIARSYSESLHNPVCGVLLPGYSPPTQPLSVWLETYRDEISHKLQTRLVRDLHRARQGADWAAVERFARSLLEIDPLNESATLGLAEAIARTGSKQKAVQLLHEYAQDVGQSLEVLSLPSRILTRRISEDVGSIPRSGRVGLVGRSDSLHMLTSTWDKSRRGSCSILSVIGEKSIGKTRVVEELAALVRLDGSGSVVCLRPLASDRERPMSLFSDLCRKLLQLPGGAGCSPESLRYLGRLTGAPDQRVETCASEVDSSVSENFTRRAILDLLDSITSERPLLICVDDGDRLDSSSLALLASLPELAPSLPLQVVLACTDTHVAPVPGREVRLSPITASESDQLSLQICTSAGYELTASAREWCTSVAAGNPGHLELLLGHVSTFGTSSIPPDLIAIVDQRLQSLTSAGRHILQACAVFGSECSPDAISTLTGLQGYELLSILESLVIDGVVSDSPTGIVCRSSLIAERVSATTTFAVRNLLNRRAAEYLERVVDDDMSKGLAWRIADHWQASGNRKQSLRWRMACWAQLVSIGQPIAAADSIRSHLTESASLGERAQLLQHLAEALRHASDAPGHLLALEERARLSDQLGDSAEVRHTLAAELAEARLNTYDDTTRVLPELRVLLRAPQLDEERRLRIARVLIVTADSMLSEALAREALESVPGRLSTATSLSLGLQVKTIYHAVFGEPGTAIECAELLLATATKQELSATQIAAHLTASLALRIVDVRPTDYTLFAELYERCIAASMVGAAIRISARAGTMLHEDGDIEEAKRWCACASELIERIGFQRLGTDFLTLQVDLALADNNVYLARRLIEAAPAYFPMYASPKWSNVYLVYRTRVEQQQGPYRLGEEQMQSLINWHHSAKRYGRHDDHMAVLWTALRDAGRLEEASTTLREYLSDSRREKRPCIHSLRMASAGDPAWSANDRSRNNSVFLEARQAFSTPSSA